MQSREPQQRTPSPASPVSPGRSDAMPPQLERTLVASGWALAELRSPVRSPLANLSVADLDASVATHRPPPLPAARPRPSPSAPSPGDPNSTRAATELAWMQAFAAASWASPGETLITPSQRRASAGSPSGRRGSPASDVTRVMPGRLAESLAAALGIPSRSTPARPGTIPETIPEEAPAQPEVAPAAAPAALPPELAALPPVPDRPQLVPDVQLLGTMRDTGFAEQQWLAQRGQAFVQLSELLYRVLEQVDGRRDLEEIAAAVRETTGRPVSANNVRLLIAARLLPLGLIVPVDGLSTDAQQPRQAGPSSLRVTLRLGFMREEWVEVVARALQVFFWPPVLLPILFMIAAGQAWLLLVHGVVGPLATAAREPLLLPALEGFIFISAIFHEFGHASALRYSGGRARGIGFGLYFIFTAFYTDCTDSYRLGRWGRMRTDLGGVYFDLITTLGLIFAYVATRQELLLVGVLYLDYEILDQFNPAARFDGYWALADLIGLPDFFLLTGPLLREARDSFLRKIRPQRLGEPAAAQRGPGLPPLKPWVKAVALTYSVLSVPVLGVSLLFVLAIAPTLLGIEGDALAAEVQLTVAAHQAGLWLPAVLAGAQALLLLGTALLGIYGLAVAVRTVIRTLWRWGAPSIQRRALSLLALAAVLAPIVVLWRLEVDALIPHFTQVVQQILQGI